MKQAILDTNFILTCVKQKIDFFEEIPLLGFKIVIPKQVISELKRLKNKNTELALKILEKNEFKEIDIGKGHVDKSLIKLAKKEKNIVLGTLDREIKEKVNAPTLIIRGKKRLEIL